MQGHKVTKTALTAAMTAFVAGGLFSTQALATEGYFQPGYSAIQKSLAGSGAANPEDAMTLAINPAGLTSVGRFGGGRAFLVFSEPQIHRHRRPGLCGAGYRQERLGELPDSRHRL